MEKVNISDLGKCEVCLNRVLTSNLKEVILPVVNIENSEKLDLKVCVQGMKICNKCAIDLALKIYQRQANSILG